MKCDSENHGQQGETGEVQIHPQTNTSRYNKSAKISGFRLQPPAQNRLAGYFPAQIFWLHRR